MPSRCRDSGGVALYGAASAAHDGELDLDLSVVLRKAGFAGRVEATLQDRLRRPVNAGRADLGRRCSRCWSKASDRARRRIQDQLHGAFFVAG